MNGTILGQGAVEQVCLPVAASQRVMEAVRRLLMGNEGKRNRRDRRRVPFFCPASVTPWEAPASLAIAAASAEAPHVSVCARDISATGIGLLHVLPLECREVVVTCKPPVGRPAAFRCQIRWCRSFAGWYASGARLLDVAQGDAKTNGALETGKAHRASEPANARDRRVLAAVRQLLASQCPEDRRELAREPFFCPVTIDQGGRQWLAFARDLSATGVGLLHTAAPECGESVASVWTTPWRATGFRAEFVWWRACAEGWYLSAVRFLDVCEPAAASPWSNLREASWALPALAGDPGGRRPKGESPP